MKDPLVVGYGAEKVVAGQDGRGAWDMLLVLGIALAIVGFVDVALLWYPARWASVDWEFGTVSAAFEGLPLGTLGLGMACAAAVARGRRRVMAVGAAVALLMSLAIVLMALVFVLDVPVVVRAVDVQLRQTLLKSLVKTTLMALVYVALYLSFGIWVVRRVWALRKGAGTS